MKRSWTSSDKRVVGANQNWVCAECKNTLPATYEVDHITPLWKGGLDCLHTNAMALCNRCHAQKTLNERISIVEARRRAIERAQAPPPMVTLNPVLEGDDSAFLNSTLLKFAFNAPRLRRPMSLHSHFFHLVRAR